MLDPKASRFWQATVLSGLMDAQGLTACWNTIPPAKREDPQHIDRRLARQAVQARALTLWQAQQLMAGRTSGFKVDRYVLLDLIGQGGMGRVYLAEDTRLNRQVALKILSPERINNPRAIARFQREARVGAQLQHENLVRIYDFGESSGRYYLVMEFIEGKTIGTMISDQNAIPAATAVRLVRQVAMGLEHAHRKGLIHRDVNPYNILVTRDGTAKLADLGLAIDLAEEDHVTREGATVGTFDYVAPEQARHSHSADIRSDIYSLGCSLYHMCTGQVPFPTPSLPEKLFAHQAMEPTPLNELVPDLPGGLAEVIRRMMQKSPDERYATPLQVAQALEPFLEEHSGAGSREHAVGILLPGATTASGSPQSHEMKASLAEPKTESAAVGLAMGNPVGLKTPSDTALQPATAAGARPVPPLLSPANIQGSDPEFPADLILSPEPSLTEARSRPKSRSNPSKSGTMADGTAATVRMPRSWLWGLAAATTVVLVLAVTFAMVNPFGDTTGRVVVSPSSEDPESKGKSPEAGNRESNNQKPILKSSPDIVVRTKAENDEGAPAKNLLDAINTAMGSRGWVELRNREPLHLTGNHGLDLVSGRGSLVIRAAPGFNPVIEFDLNGSQPLLTTGSGVPLTMSGVTIVVHYPPPSAASSPTLPALVDAAGVSRFERCAFKVASGSHPKGSRALFSNMGALEVDRCWFEGFDKAIEVVANSNARVKISQTMIVPSPVADLAQEQMSDGYGWAVKMQFSGAIVPPSKKSRAHLILEHCTVDGAGFIDIGSGMGPGPVQVEVRHCALRADSLLAFNPTRPNTEEQISWRGGGNQYDICGRSWIVHSASAGSPVFSVAITDLASWLRFAKDEADPVQTKLKYRTDPKARPDSLRPNDFAIEPSGPPQFHPGASPELVGPWSKP